MIWQDWDAFWAMGGYGLYVWGSVLVVLASIAGEFTGQVLKRKALLRALKRGHT